MTGARARVPVECAAAALPGSMPRCVLCSTLICLPLSPDIGCSLALADCARQPTVALNLDLVERVQPDDGRRLGLLAAALAPDE